LNSILQQVHLGVTGAATSGLPSTPGGLLASLDDADKKVVEDWVAAMEPIVTALNDPMLDDREKYMEGLDAQILALGEYVGVAEDEAVAAGGDDKGLPPELSGAIGIEAPADAGGVVAPADAATVAPADPSAPAPAPAAAADEAAAP
jgi:hypothetical protein